MCVPTYAWIGVPLTYAWIVPLKENNAEGDFGIYALVKPWDLTTFACARYNQIGLSVRCDHV